MEQIGFTRKAGTRSAATESRKESTTRRFIEDAKAVEAAGAFCLLVEMTTVGHRAWRRTVSLPQTR